MRGFGRHCVVTCFPPGQFACEFLLVNRVGRLLEIGFIPPVAIAATERGKTIYIYIYINKKVYIDTRYKTEDSNSHSDVVY